MFNIMEYLRKFLNRAEYEAATINRPGVSLICDTRTVKYDRYPKGFVDLGLPSGNYWAKCNIGAENETDPGWYVAWGELAQKEGWMEDKETHPYNNEDYRFFPEGEEEEDYEYTKYNSIDGKLVLDPEDDIATVTLGDGGYRIPTLEDYFELCEWCRPEYVGNYKNTGVNGMRFFRNNTIAPAFKNVTLYSNIFDMERQMYEIDDEVWTELSLMSREEINAVLFNAFGEDIDVVDCMFLDIEGQHLATLGVDYGFTEKEINRDINIFVPFGKFEILTSYEVNDLLDKILEGSYIINE